MHWINVIALTILFMSGLNIFSAHPALYWGKSSYNGRPPILQIGSAADANDNLIGVTRIFGHEFTTTGVLGASSAPGGQLTGRAFPSWLTIPDGRWLSMARQWHFFFAWVFVINGLCYVAYSIVSRHLARDLAPTGAELGSIPQSIVDHLPFRHPSGEASNRNNVLRKITYLVVILWRLPLVTRLGRPMSPG